MNIEIGSKALVTTDTWFIAPDGNQYRAVFGTVRGCYIAEEVLGIKPNAKSTNWYLEIGNMIIAGCQIHYAMRTDECNSGSGTGWTADADKINVYETPCSIYFADET